MTLQRKNKLNNVILHFNLTSDNPNSAKYNPLGEIRLGLHEFEDAKAISEMIIPENSQGYSDHWRRSAVSLLTCAILHKLYSQKDRTITGVFNLLCDSKRPIYEVLDSMMTTEHDPEGTYNWKDPITNQPTKTHPAVASIAKDLHAKNFEEISNIASVVFAYLTLFRDPIIAKNTGKSDFTIEEII